MHQYLYYRVSYFLTRIIMALQVIYSDKKSRFNEIFSQCVEAFCRNSLGTQIIMFHSVVLGKTFDHKHSITTHKRPPPCIFNNAFLGIFTVAILWACGHQMLFIAIYRLALICSYLLNKLGKISDHMM